MTMTEQAWRSAARRDGDSCHAPAIPMPDVTMGQQQAVEEASAAAGCGQPGEAVGQGGSPAADSRAAAKAALTADAGKRNGAAAPGSAVSAVTNAGEQNAARAPGSGAATAAKSFAPAQTATYLSPQYWDERFAVEDSYEWCKASAQPSSTAKRLQRAAARKWAAHKH